jgi:DNA-binding SARP family transcriptional activator
LLGPPRIERDGEPVRIQRRKAVALLVYLAVTGCSHSRDALATLLWPEYDQSSARNSLRVALAALRGTLGEAWADDADRSAVGQHPLDIDEETIRLHLECDVWLDLAEFRERLSACEMHGHPVTETCPDCLPLLEEAAMLYRDDFLASFTLRDSPGFDEFQFFQTEGLRNQLAGALERLVCHHSAQGEYEAAIPHARRWLALDPLHEPAHRHLMALYAQSGQQSAALRQYKECARILKEELDLSPSQETTSLYERVRAGPADHSERRFVAAGPRHNLPVQPTPFIGREDELTEIAARLRDPDCRLLTLLGPGGNGKTRLALEAASAQLDNFEHGVFFVSLAPLRSVDAIVPTTANAIGFSFYGGGEPRQQLLDYLREKCMLIILDNYEHLLEGAGLVAQVLETAPHVKILATSRARLNVGANTASRSPE